MLAGVTWFRQSSVRIRRGGVEIHIDPWGIPEGSTADYILLTHPHFDNFSEDDIAKVRGRDTTLVAPASMRHQLEDVDHLMRPGDMVHLDGIEILAVPADNEDKKFHPPEKQWLGYVFTVDGIRYDHSGDTDFREKMRQIRIDVGLLTAGGHCTLGGWV